MYAHALVYKLRFDLQWLTGAFGKVFRGQLLTRNSAKPLDVAIKTIKRKFD